MKDGGSKRRAAAEAAVKGVGGKLEVFYFAFGETDVYAIADVPDNASAAAISLAVTGSGAVNARTTVLMTPEEMDQATKKTISYGPPGR
jgi:uncharacterized protein with GYD domain